MSTALDVPRRGFLALLLGTAGLAAAGFAAAKERFTGGYKVTYLDAAGREVEPMEIRTGLEQIEQLDPVANVLARAKLARAAGYSRMAVSRDEHQAMKKHLESKEQYTGGWSFPDAPLLAVGVECVVE